MEALFYSLQKEAELQRKRAESNGVWGFSRTDHSQMPRRDPYPHCKASISLSNLHLTSLIMMGPRYGMVKWWKKFQPTNGLVTQTVSPYQVRMLRCDRDCGGSTYRWWGFRSTWPNRCLRIWERTRISDSVLISLILRRLRLVCTRFTRGVTPHMLNLHTRNGIKMIVRWLQ